MYTNNNNNNNNRRTSGIGCAQPILRSWFSAATADVAVLRPGHWTAASGMQMAMAYPVAVAGPVDHDLALPVDPNVIIHNTAHARPLAWRDEDVATAVIAQNKSVCMLIDLVGKL